MPSRFDPQIPFDGAQGKHHRHSIRLKGFDYSQAGAYFVTIVTRQRECLFGEIANGEMKLNNYGSIVAKTWKWLEDQYSYIELLHGVVMPNHFHGLVTYHETVGATRQGKTNASSNKTPSHNKATDGVRDILYPPFTRLTFIDE